MDDFCEELFGVGIWCVGGDLGGFLGVGWGMGYWRVGVEIM